MNILRFVPSYIHACFNRILCPHNASGIKLKMLVSILLCIGTGGMLADELPIPAVPDSITAPADRVDYLLAHFWDDVDFTDSAFMAYGMESIEKAFVSYLRLMPDAGMKNVEESVDNMLGKAAASQSVYTAVYYMAGKYLNTATSPMRDEGLYILFLNHASKCQSLGEADRERAKFRLSMAMKNRPGSIVPDFRFMSREGTEQTLMRALSGDYSILIFYDPDCGNCEEVMQRIVARPELRNAGVIAIYADEDRNLWNETKGKLPESWTVGFSLDPIQDEELYILPEMPTLYLLDADGRVILKEASVDSIVDKLR